MNYKVIVVFQFHAINYKSVKNFNSKKEAKKYIQQVNKANKCRCAYFA